MLGLFGLILANLPLEKVFLHPFDNFADVHWQFLQSQIKSYLFWSLTSVSPFLIFQNLRDKK